MSFGKFVPKKRTICKLKSFAYYNEIAPKAAAWLRELIKQNLIAPGEVDERDIRDVIPSDLKNFTQCHFFAGIGVWSYALRRAGWPDDQKVWTGSCPCQPFSAAGRRKGASDERHLWPSWQWLIRQSKPHVVFGEQVASKDGIVWLDSVLNDLEGEDYTVGAAVLPACGVGAPHLRQRIWFVADSNGAGLEKRNGTEAREKFPTSKRDRINGHIKLAYSMRARRPEGGSVSGKGSPTGSGLTGGFWADAEWLLCTDGKARPIEPGSFPLAHGAPARMGRLRGYGNAIVAQAAQAFIEVYRETI